MSNTVIKIRFFKLRKPLKKTKNMSLQNTTNITKIGQTHDKSHILINFTDTTWVLCSTAILFLMVINKDIYKIYKII